MSKKFDVVIGNPPYQGDLVGEQTTSPPIYHLFMEESYNISDKVCLITPGRFLFNTGRTPKKWNRNMLNSPHLKIIDYRADSSDVFSNTDIMGGIVVTYHDKSKKGEPIVVFTPHPELDSVLNKLEDVESSLTDIMYSQTIFKFTEELHIDVPEVPRLLSKGNSFVVGTGVFKSLGGLVFHTEKPNDGYDYIKLFGLEDMVRTYRWIRSDYINNPDNLHCWKVFVPQANGSGAIGEVDKTSIIGEPVLGEPGVGNTQTFISIGAFNVKSEAESCLKYVKSKFTRSMLGILKATQHNPVRTWEKVPLQDFTEDSDIDWSKSIAEIDQQLYKKYNLNEEEIDFIESNIKEMD